MQLSMCSCYLGSTVFSHSSTRFHTFLCWPQIRSIVFIQQHRGWGTRAKNLGLERLVLAHRWLWPVLQKRYTWVFRTWWKPLKRQYTSNKSFFWRILPNVKLRGFSQSWIFNMRVSERLRSLVFIQKLFSKEFSSYPGELQCTGFHLQYNFGYGNLKCLHRMKTRGLSFMNMTYHKVKTQGLSFMSSTLECQKCQALVFSCCSLYLRHNFYWRILAPIWG